MESANRLRINLERLERSLIASAEIGAIQGGGICRPALTDEDQAMRDLYVGWLKERGLQVRVDDFGNIYGRKPGRNPELAPVLIGSHLDTQLEGGRFDGIYGVLAGLEVLDALLENGIQTERPIDIVNFTSEEGSRFEPPMLGSGGVAGEFPEDYVLSREDGQGLTFGGELKRIGYAGSKANRASGVHGYVELHIEQGPILEKNAVSIGAVEGIQGMTWLSVRLKGETAHAGPTPMHGRKDALLVASMIRVAIQEVIRDVDPNIRLTVGKMSLYPNVANCVPGEVSFSVDIRHMNDAIREQAIEYVTYKMATLASKENIGIQVNTHWNVNAVYFAPKIVDLVLEGASAYGYSSMPISSGAGHDSKHMSQITDTGMIFVPSVNGKSHCIEELTLPEDLEKGANILLYVALRLANEI